MGHPAYRSCTFYASFLYFITYVYVCTVANMQKCALQFKKFSMSKSIYDSLRRLLNKKSGKQCSERRGNVGG